MRVHEFIFRSINGASMPLERWTGQPLLIVNTASDCGHTPQYLKLELLWQEYRHTGLIVIGVPCNDFAEQEPGSDEEIMEFCTSNYSVTFPMTTKQSIIGVGAHPLFTAMREEYTSNILPKWNFCKYLFGREGTLLHNWDSTVEPDEPGLRHDLERNLSSWSM